MRSSNQISTLHELPSPPPGKRGWPWIIESSIIPDAQANVQDWPRVSIVTPSYNQADFLEETLRSVLLQGYPNLEYIVIDGGSDDGSVEILERYDEWLTYWVSEPDDGQTQAINKGMARATGEILAYLNSDDVYYADTLVAAVAVFQDKQADLLIGAVDVVMVDGVQRDFIRKESPAEGTPTHFFPIFKHGHELPIRFLQPGSFWTRELWERVGGFDERYHLIMDREWFTRSAARGARIKITDQPLAHFALHAGSKTQEQELEFLLERAQMYARFSQRAEFRALPSILESLRWYLRYGQDKTYVRYEELRENRKQAQAALIHLVSRILRRLRMLIDGMAARWRTGR